MKYRFGLLGILISLFFHVSIGCGGGGTGGGGAGGVGSHEAILNAEKVSEILELFPSGDYSSLGVMNPRGLYGSSLFKRTIEVHADEVPPDFYDMLAGFSRERGVEPHRHNLAIFLSSSTKSNILEYNGEALDSELLKKVLFEKNWNEDIIEVEMSGQRYLTFDPNRRSPGRETAYYHAAGGIFTGSEDIIKGVITAMIEKKKRLVDDKDFIRARELADFGASGVVLQWNSFKVRKKELKFIKERSADESETDRLLKARRAVKALGLSFYLYADNLSFSIKILFADSASAATVQTFIESNREYLIQLVRTGVGETPLYGSNEYEKELLGSLSIRREGNLMAMGCMVSAEAVAKTAALGPRAAEEEYKEELVPEKTMPKPDR